jgi:serine/threonine protein kinase/tetratricopeptide (TPR) repeat protein
MTGTNLSSSVPYPVSSGLVDGLAAEMAAAWRRGERVPAEAFLARYPDLLDTPEDAVRLVYEEVCLRQENGEAVAADELSRRFPRWSGELAVLLDCHRLLESRLPPPAFPGVGDSLGDFRIVAELGRGAQGRVFLATQPSLANRPVVLKASPRRAREHLSLARLQHTHIIPLHAMYDFPDRNLRALCLPFLGGATLARVLEVLHGRPVADRSGQSVVDALDVAQKEAPVRLLGRGGYRQVLAGLSYAEAVCHIGACLADGLHYAHERGLVHLDLKPSNVLLAADAQPLLLDFHLAVHPLRAGQPAPEWFGGTPAYMSPEQEAACAAGRRGGAAPLGVDGRSDIFSLGCLLYAALAGDDAASDSRPTPLSRRNPRVSVGLSDIVLKCLAPSPGDRYPSAAALAGDLRRHLAHLPLQGVRNRDPRERWHKWRRRRPGVPLWVGLLLALASAGSALAAGAVERYRDARGALAEGKDQMQRRAYREAVRTLTRGRARADGVPGGAGLVKAIDSQLHQARRAEAAGDLHAVAERLRFLAGAERPTAELKAMATKCCTTWEARGLLADRAAAPLDADAEEQLRADLLDVALLWAELDRQTGRAVLAEAEELLGPCPALTRARQGSGVATGVGAQQAGTPWEHVAFGRALLRSGELERAAAELERAADLRPQDFWAHFYRGVCAYRQRQYDAAVHSFGVAVALAPGSAECYYNRALAYAARGKYDRALADYDRALALAPRLAAAELNRGVVHYQEGRYARALADLEAALRDGTEPATAHYNLALVCLALHDETATRRHLDQALQHDPTHEDARSLRERLLRRQ